MALKVKPIEDAELNLTAVMNLFMVIIPFLLAGAAFAHFGVVPVSTPTHDPGSSDVPKTPTTVAVTLVIKAEGLELTAASVSLTPEEIDSLGFKRPIKNGDYDLAGLQAHLAMLKGKYPASNTIIVIPFNGLDYQKLVEILDVTRERITGVASDGTDTAEELFPVTVFSRFIPPSEAPAEPAPSEPAPMDAPMEPTP